MGRRCCCANCKATKTLSSLPDWAAGTDGTISAPAGGGLAMHGEVNPASLLASEAYLLSFHLKGAVSIDIGGVTIAADATAQTITAGGTSVICGQSTASPLTLYVWIRVTPSHVCVWAAGNYGRTFTGQTLDPCHYGILTADRSGAVPASITATWENALVSQAAVADSSVVVTSNGDYSEPTYERLCFTPPAYLLCPYLVTKTVTRDHLYQAAPYGDVPMPDISVDGDDPFAELYSGDFGDWIGPTHWGLYRESDAYPTPSEPYNGRFNGGFCTGQAFASRWYQQQEVGASPTYVKAVLDTSGNPFCSCNYSLSLRWPDPTPAAPYPKPEFVAALHTSHASGSSYASGGDVVAVLAVNALTAGFTLSAVPVVTKDEGEVLFEYLVGATWSFSP